MKMLRFAAACVLLFLAAILLSVRAEASTTCTATMTDVNFGTVNPTGGLVNVSATLSYSCTTNNGVLGGLYTNYVTACFSIGGGSQGTSLTPRVMKDAAGDVMNFQLYTDAARSVVWGSVFAAGISPPQINLQIAGNGTQNGSLTVYAQVPANQTGLGSGTYISLFSGANAQVNFASNEAFLNIGGGYPASCSNGPSGASTSNFSFSANANVQTACKINTATDLSFGSAPGLLASNVDQTSSITLTCVANTAWQVGLDNGQHANGTIRRMILGANFVTYELYRDINRTLRWGNTINTDTQVGSGTGSAQTLTVYGRVPPQTAVPGVGYADKVTVTITF